MAKKKRLLFIAPTPELDSGGELSHLELIKSARLRGYLVRVILPANGSFSEQVERLRIPYDIVNYTWWSPNVFPQTALNGMAAVSTVSAIAKRWGADTVISNTLNIPWGALVAGVNQLPHAWIAREFPSGEFEYLKDRYGYIDSLSDAVIANSQNLAKYMREHKLVPNAEFFYSFVDASGLHLAKPVSAQPRLILVGAIQDRKNQIEAIKALVILRDKYQLKPEMLIIGSGDESYTEDLQLYIEEHDLKSQVEFVGYKSAPWSLVRKTDLYIQPSKSESIGRTATEAMKLGVFCIGADIPGTREAFELGGGEVYKLGDIKDLASKIANTLNSDYVANAGVIKQRVAETMSEQACSEPFFSVIERVTSAKCKPKDLTELGLLFSALEQNRRHTQNERETMLGDIAKLKRHIDSIEGSRMWKVMQRVRSITHL